jgi:hypothetical protein
VLTSGNVVELVVIPLDELTATAPELVRPVKVPRLVKLEVTTLLARTVPVSVPAAATVPLETHANPDPDQDKNVFETAGTEINPVVFAPV